MQPISVTLAALGNSLWVPINRLQNAFNLGLQGYISSGASLTWKVQHTSDPTNQEFRPVTITRVTTVATVKDIAHGLSVGDSVFIFATGDANLDKATAVDVASVVDADNYTYTVVNTGAASGASTSKIKSFRVQDHASLTGQVGKAFGNYTSPIQMVRLVTTIYVSGSVTLDITQGLGT